MKILAVDLGKFKSVACDYESGDGEHEFETIQTSPQQMHDLIVKRAPDRVVIEVCNLAGWIHDLATALEVPIQVANPNHEGWRWKKVKRKTDRDDALKLAKLSSSNDLPTVYVPGSKVRQWRGLIGYRHKLIGRRTAIKNSIRALLDSQGLKAPSGTSGWSSKSLERFRDMARPMLEVDSAELWRGQLFMELQALEQVQTLIVPVDAKLDRLAAADSRVVQLTKMYGIGNRMAEAAVAIIDDPRRFKNARQVGAYAGLTPQQFESGQMKRQGKISKRGNSLIRKLLVQIAWSMRRRNAHVRHLFQRISRGEKNRQKHAVIAVARKLWVWCWAVLRDNQGWRGPVAEGAIQVK